MAAKPKPRPGSYEKTREPGIYRRNGVYIVRIYNSETKKRDDYTAFSFEQAKEIKREAQQQKKTRRRSGRVFTVREFAGEDGLLWTLPRKRPWKESTVLYKAERLSWFIRDFGSRTLGSITELEAHQWGAKHPGRVPVVKAAMQDAVRLKLIPENPFAGLQLDPGRGRQDIVVLTDRELDALKNVAIRRFGDFARDVIAPMIDVAAGLGCRPGELFAIEAADIDFREGEVHIWQQHNARTRKYGSVKNDQVNRRVVMLPRARAALESIELPERGPIFRAVRGGPFTRRQQEFYWPRIRDEFTASLPPSHHLQRRAREELAGGPLDWYEMRHKFGTELARMGCSAVEIAQQMGHTDNGKTAMKHYIHVTEEDSVSSIKKRLGAAA